MCSLLSKLSPSTRTEFHSDQFKVEYFALPLKFRPIGRPTVLEKLFYDQQSLCVYGIGIQCDVIKRVRLRVPTWLECGLLCSIVRPA